MFNLFTATISRIYKICHRDAVCGVHGWRATTNHGMRLQATWPSKRENGWGEGDWGWGIIYNFQEKQGLKYCDLPLHQSILTANFNISMFIWEWSYQPLQYTPNNVLYNYFTVQHLQYNICSTISVVQYPQLNICGTISAVQCLRYNICCTTFAVQYLQYNYFTVYPLLGWLSIDAWGVKTCIFSFTPVYAKSCICYVSVKTAGPLHFR